MTLSMPRLLLALRAAAEPTRLRLLAICAEGELSVGEITEVVGQSQPRVSRHLKLLCDAGLLVRFRDHNWIFYGVPPKGSGARLVRFVLNLLDTDDDKRELDHQRTEQLKRRRARQASHYLSHLGDASRLADHAPTESEVDSAILDVLSGVELGELLDIGTGTGRILKLLGERAEHAMGIDISSEMLLVARSNLHAAGLDRCMVRPGDMYQLPFANDSFDTVTIDQVLNEAERPFAAIAEAARILKSEGRLLIVESLAQDKDRGLDDRQVSTLLTDAGLVSEDLRRIPQGSPAAWLCLARLPAVGQSDGTNSNTEEHLALDEHPH